MSRPLLEPKEGNNAIDIDGEKWLGGASYQR